jgi:hypothetical protein
VAHARHYETAVAGCGDGLSQRPISKTCDNTQVALHQ